MKKVLIIAGQYFPFAVPCAYRVHSFAKHLPYFGYKPFIISIDWTIDLVEKQEYFGSGAYSPDSTKQISCEVARVPYPSNKPPFFARLKGVLTGMGANPILEQAYRTTINTIWDNSNGFDAIIATKPNPSAFEAAAWASHRYNVPWIADFRDVVGQYSTVPKQNISQLLNNPKKYLLTWLCKYTNQIKADKEVEFCKSSFAQTTVSEGLADYLRERGLSNVETVINGYEPEEYQSVEAELSNKFRIVYAGALHWDQNPSLLFDALDQILVEKKEFINSAEVLFYGVEEEKLAHFLKGRICRQILKASPRIAKERIQAIMKGSDILLHLSHPNTKGIMTSKLTEYLGAGRPILSIPGDGDTVDSFIKETNAGVSLDTDTKIKNYLLSQFENWKETGKTDYNCNESVKIFYTRKQQVRILSILLKKAIRTYPKTHFLML